MCIRDRVPGTGIFGAIWKFVSTIILGRLFMILFDHLPKLLPILKVAAVFADGFIKVVGFLGTLAMNVIDAGYKLVNGVSNWVGETFGEDVKKGFDTFLGVIKDLVAAFLVWKIIGKKIRPTNKEISENRRARSALLRIAERM